MSFYVYSIGVRYELFNLFALLVECFDCRVGDNVVNVQNGGFFLRRYHSDFRGLAMEKDEKT